MNTDIKEYLDELNSAEDLTEEENVRSSEEEAHIEWLQEIGLSEVTEPVQAGLEVSLKDIEPFLAGFSSAQKETIRRRVNTLNNTVRQNRKSKSKYRKADVRDVFKDVSEPRKSADYATLEENLEKKKLSRAPSAPIQNSISKTRPSLTDNVTVNHELFRNYVPDVPTMLTDGLILLRYTNVGTLPRQRSGSDPLLLDDNNYSGDLLRVSSSRLSRSHGSLLDLSENFSVESSLQEEHLDRTRIESLDEKDVEKLKRWFFIEVSSLMDSCEGDVMKRKHVRQNKRIETNVFGVPIKNLIEKDEKFRDTLKDESYQPNVPIVLQKLIKHLRNNFIKEEGLFRVAGLKTRIDILLSDLETHFYLNPRKVDKTLYKMTPHDITSAVKKFLRDIPDPVLTSKYIHHFYNTHLLSLEDQRNALNLLVLLLPREHQATLKYLVNFFNQLSDYEEFNKMNIHGISTILAPSLFPPRYLNLSKEDVKTQVSQAENCIRLTEVILKFGDNLWLVPSHLLKQLREYNSKRKYRKENRIPRRLSSNIIRVETSQFRQLFWSVAINKNTTAKDVVLKIINEVSKIEDQTVFSKGQGNKLAELITEDVALSCILSTADPETCLKTHFLYEYGGNIVKRELEHNTLVYSVLQANPEATLKIECHHRTRTKR